MTWWHSVYCLTLERIEALLVSKVVQVRRLDGRLEPLWKKLHLLTHICTFCFAYLHGRSSIVNLRLFQFWHCWVGPTDCWATWPWPRNYDVVRKKTLDASDYYSWLSGLKSLNVSDLDLVDLVMLAFAGDSCFVNVVSAKRPRGIWEDRESRRLKSTRVGGDQVTVSWVLKIAIAVGRWERTLDIFHYKQTIHENSQLSSAVAWEGDRVLPLVWPPKRRTSMCLSVRRLARVWSVRVSLSQFGSRSLLYNATFMIRFISWIWWVSYS